MTFQVSCKFTCGNRLKGLGKKQVAKHKVCVCVFVRMWICFDGGDDGKLSVHTWDQKPSKQTEARRTQI